MTTEPTIKERVDAKYEASKKEPTIVSNDTDPEYPLPTIEPAVVNPLTIIQGAIAQGIGADELGKLMDLQERWEANQAQKAFSAALAGFQAAVPTITKNKEATPDGKFGGYRFASYDYIMKEIKPFLARAGLSVRFTTETTGESVITSTCTVTHRDGHSEDSHFAAPVDSQMRVNNTQKMGSANSYAKRYCLVNALNLSVSDEVDDDGAGAGTKTVTDEQAATIREHIEALEDGWTETDNEKFLKYMCVEEIDDIRADRYEAALKAIYIKDTKS